MKQLLLIVLVICLMGMPVMAQDGTAIPDYDTIFSECLSITGDTGSGVAACETYANCQVNTSDALCPLPYQQEVINTRTGLCRDDLSGSAFNTGFCEDYATCLVLTPAVDCQTAQLLQLFDACATTGRADCERYATTQLSLSGLPFSLVEGSVRAGLANAFLAYAEGAAGIAAERTYDYAIAPMDVYYLTQVGIGNLMAAGGEYRIAIDNYYRSIAAQYQNPLAFYFRSLAYTAIGEDDLAGRDAYIYAVQASDELKTIFAPLSADFTPPDIEQWVSYPVLKMVSSPGGTYYSDLTLADSIPVDLALLDDDTLAVTSVTSGGRDTFEFLSTGIPVREETDYLLVRERQGEPGVCCGAGGQLEMTAYDGYYTFIHLNYGGESSTVIRGVLLPADAADPRTVIERTCDGLAISNLEADDRLISPGIGQPTLVYSEPDTETDYEVVSVQNVTMIVEGEPLCTEDSIWWQVSYESDAGWVQEVYQGNTILTPAGYQLETDVRVILELED